MKIVKQESEFGLNIFLKDDSKKLAIIFGGNGDLYWSLHSNDVSKDNEFVITKENYEVYQLFQNLFSDIENINIFNEEEIPFYIDGEEEKIEYLERRKEELEYEKKKYKLFNHSNYNELYDCNENIITWYSDETAHDVANILKIKKEENSFRLEFYIQHRIDGYDEDFHSLNYIPIRFRNSGSSYDPFNIVFMKMYNNMKEIDDVHDIGHQIHIEEYLYQKTKVKKFTK